MKNTVCWQTVFHFACTIEVKLDISLTCENQEINVNNLLESMIIFLNWLLKKTDSFTDADQWKC